MSEIREAWPAIRVILREFHFSDIKDIVAASGLDVQRLSHLQQSSGFKGASKATLLDEIEKILFQKEIDEQNRIVACCITEMLPHSRERLEELLSRFGWGLSGEVPYPLALQVNLEIGSLPQPIQAGLQKALRRYRDGDISGSITSICGTLDTITEGIYQSKNLGNHRDAAYQERISRSYNTLEDRFKETLTRACYPADEVGKVWNNQRAAINQAAYVLGSYRRQVSDVHGDQNVDPELAQVALDNAVFIIRAFSSYL